MSRTLLRGLRARQILDSRGRPTVEVDVLLDDDVIGRASVPSGASTGAAEAHELRDRDPRDYEGLSVRQAVRNVTTTIADAVRGIDVLDQAALDARMIECDGTEQLRRLGANAVLAVSLAACRASAAALRVPLYRRIATLAGCETISLPMPMVNILSGGLHAGRGMDVQDFLAVPAGADSMEQAIAMIARVRSSAATLMARQGLSTLLADEGGLSPGYASADQALQLMTDATLEAGLQPGRDIVVAIDVAATALRQRPASDGTAAVYTLTREGRSADSAQMIAMARSWVERFPVVSIEDALDEEDWDGWRELSAQLGGRCQLIGDDLFATNPQRVARGIGSGVANGVLIKVNQNGTLSGTLAVVRRAREAGYAAVISARSGETEDAFLADLAVGTGAGQIKIGSLRGGERLAKYNQLLRIAEEAGAPFAGMSGFSGQRS